MTHIPDEAVQAAMDKCNDVDWVSALAGTGLCGRELIVSALTAAYPYLSAPCAVEVPTKEERHANTSRNLIINQTSTDLEQIINGHDPDHSILNNDVWDRLDKMACEIEALTKPVDVAAVRRQAFEEGFENGVEQSLNALDAYDDITRNEAEQGIRKLKPDYRALSAEPAQGEQWRPIETAPINQSILVHYDDGEIELISADDNDYAWVAYTGKEDSCTKPTHWMPLPSAPNSEAVK